jgi:NADH-quinone oxidoreductase subunit J
MVLFLFVIMLLGVDRNETLVETLKGQRWVAVLLGVALALELFFAIRLGLGLGSGDVPDVPVGGVRDLARVLFGRYFFPFEVTSLLLIVAAIAAMVLARRHPEARTVRRTEEELVEEEREASRR